MRSKIIHACSHVLVVLGCGFLNPKPSCAQASYVYQPDDQKLHDTIAYLDSVFFAAYNTCALNLKEYASFYADSLEFYHDKNGLMASKQEVVNSTKKYVCGKVTRELVKGSIEVYPIKGYGAIEMGFHRFNNNTEPVGTPSHASKFIIFWQHRNQRWKITKVVSLH
jgi:hypothetical protein